MAGNSDEFFEPRVRFGIRKPRGWRFASPAWSPSAHPGRLDDVDWRRCQRLPFVSLSGAASPRQPRPTLRVACRPAGRHGPDEIRRLLELQAQMLRDELDGVEILRSSYDAILAGHRAAHVRFRYSVPVLERGRSWTMRVLARSYLVLTPGLAFTIGTAASADDPRGAEAEISLALSSIRIGTPGEDLPLTRREETA